MSNRFFTAKGTPSSGSSRVRAPFAEASEASTCAARRSARSASTDVKALTLPSVASTRSRLACTSAVALAAPVRTASTMAVASRASKSAVLMLPSPAA
jgi:hypothetical protein